MDTETLPRLPHELSMFSLVARNQAANDIILSPDNRHLASLVATTLSGEVYGLNIGPHIKSAEKWTLATLGREGDIRIPYASISRKQCAFEINQHTGLVLLADYSTQESTSTHGADAIPFTRGRRPRKILLDPNCNTEFTIGAGRARCDFRLVWHEQPIDARPVLDSKEENLHNAVTVEEPPTEPSSRRSTRCHTPGFEFRLRYRKVRLLGRGAFGQVWVAQDYDTADIYAVKEITFPPDKADCYRQLWKREAETLARAKHDNVVELIHAYEEDTTLCVVMGCKDGNIETLKHKIAPEKRAITADAICKQMLSALAFIHSHKIIHRDVKGANILFSQLGDGSYSFQLADFGLARFATAEMTFRVGTTRHWAPEMFSSPDQVTTAIDVWALLVTLLDFVEPQTFDKQPFWRAKSTDFAPFRQFVQELAASAGLKPMSATKPDQRATARDMLRQIYPDVEPVLATTPAVLFNPKVEAIALIQPRRGSTVSRNIIQTRAATRKAIGKQ